MKFLKGILKILAKPGKVTAAVAVCLFAASVGAMITVLFVSPQSIWYYVLNAITVVLFGYVVFLVVLLCKYLKPRVIVRAQRFSFTSKFVASYDFRTVIYASGRFIINVGYALFTGIYGFIFLNPWYIALFAYYIVLVIARGSMVARSRKVAKSLCSDAERQCEKLKIYRAAGILLLVFTLVLDTMLVLMLKGFEHGFRYAGMLIFAAAGFTVYKVVMAIINLVKARGSADPVVHAIRNINFSEALVSLMSLQTAMGVHFSIDMDKTLGGIQTGLCICVFTTVLGIYMIVKAQRRIAAVRTATESGGEAMSAECAAGGLQGDNTCGNR